MSIHRSSFLTAALTIGLTSSRLLRTPLSNRPPTPAPAAKPTQSISQKIAASKDLLDINTATAAQLKALPGMGDAYVQRIIAAGPTPRRTS